MEREVEGFNEISVEENNQQENDMVDDTGLEQHEEQNYEAEEEEENHKDEDDRLFLSNRFFQFTTYITNQPHKILYNISISINIQKIILINNYFT